MFHGIFQGKWAKSKILIGKRDFVSRDGGMEERMIGIKIDTKMGIDIRI